MNIQFYSPKKDFLTQLSITLVCFALPANDKSAEHRIDDKDTFAYTASSRLNASADFYTPLESSEDTQPEEIMEEALIIADEEPTELQSRNAVLAGDASLDASTRELISKNLGANGLARLETFKTYQAGWDGNRGAALVLESESQLIEFLVEDYLDPQNLPSIFLTRNGNLQLGWEDKKGYAIEVEFFSSHVEYFLEAYDLEGQASFAGLRTILKSVS